MVSNMPVSEYPSEKISLGDSVKIKLAAGGFDGKFISFKGIPENKEHFAIALGKVPTFGYPLVRLHSECVTGDVFGSMRCDCGPQLREATRMISKDGGYLLYLRQEGRGIGLFAKISAYRLQDEGLDTYEANRHLNFPEDMRDYSAAAHMLEALGHRQIRLLTNNPTKIQALAQHGINVVERVPTGVFINETNQRYLVTKATKANHLIEINGSAPQK